MVKPLAILAFVAVILLGGIASVAFLGIIFESPHIFQFVSKYPQVFPDSVSTGTTTNLSPNVMVSARPKNSDAEPTEPLAAPPAFVKAVYATSWSAGSQKKVDYLIDLIRESELNAVVIDVKDYSGYIAYRTELDLPREYDAIDIRIPKINALLARLHAEHIYAIARISVFQDERLALARPDLAIMSSSTGAVWRDRKGLSWIDPASREVWEYNAAIAREVFKRGFDEVNFDYIRFPSDGNLTDLRYPVWDGRKGTAVLNEFWAYLRSEFRTQPISADLFGLTTVDTGDLGIGQKLQVALPHFDHVAPMVYPSHYGKGTFGFANPAEYPYEVIKRSLDGALEQIAAYESHVASGTPAVPKTAKVRPWLQDFNLGATYTAEMVREEIRAVEEAASSSPDHISGWMLWNPANVYTRKALATENE